MKHLQYRFLYMIALGISLAVAFKYLVYRDFMRHSIGFDIAIFVPAAILLWEGNLRLDTWLNKRYAWMVQPRKRIIYQLVLSLSYSFLILFGLLATIHQMTDPDRHFLDPRMRQSLLIGTLIASTIQALDISFQFFKAWKNSLIEVAKYKTESVQAQLQNLKNQINPHFLFNNLSVLSSLVYKDQDKAVHFINELSKVYRYVLDNRNTELSTLREELAFLDHYIYLQQIRFEDSIVFQLDISENEKSLYVLPMCLQMLVENTIQHNEASQAKPLTVRIFTKNHTLNVENPLQPRNEQTESSKTGLKNIQMRYAFFTDQKVEIIRTEKSFRVSLPLIVKK